MVWYVIIVIAHVYIILMAQINVKNDKLDMGLFFLPDMVKADDSVFLAEFGQTHNQLVQKNSEASGINYNQNCL